MFLKISGRGFARKFRAIARLPHPLEFFTKKCIDKIKGVLALVLSISRQNGNSSSTAFSITNLMHVTNCHIELISVVSSNWSLVLRRLSWIWAIRLLKMLFAVSAILLVAITHFTLHCYRIDEWAIRRPWLTFVNAFANSMLGRFYTAKNSKICFVRLA